MLPLIVASEERGKVEALRAKLSLKPLLLEGLDAEMGGESGGGGEGKVSRFEAVRRILRDVQARGDAALVDYTKQFDGGEVTAGTLRVGEEEIDAAVAGAEPGFLRALDKAITNIRRYQTAMMAREPEPIATADGKGWLGMKFTPLERVGLYVPGGAAAYPSSVLHTAIPAQVAGVKGLCLCSPMRGGRIAPAVLAAAAKVGVREIYAVGGAQAVAAMAFGTATVRAVDKIVGPGNIYVQLAKKELYGLVDIDSFAGPSEVIVLADDSAGPEEVAAELLAQAEHAPGSCLLITASRGLGMRVRDEVEKRLAGLSREGLTRAALSFASAIILADSHEHALALVDSFAPEHLQITTRGAREDARRVRNAGAIFIGPFTPVAAGDYLAGPSHVLPTSGTGRFFSGLSADSFRKRSSVVEYDRGALDAAGPDIVSFALTEGFDGHAKSVTSRSGVEERLGG